MLHMINEISINSESKAPKTPFYLLVGFIADFGGLAVALYYVFRALVRYLTRNNLEDHLVGELLAD